MPTHKIEHMGYNFHNFFYENNKSGEVKCKRAKATRRFLWLLLNVREVVACPKTRLRDCGGKKVDFALKII